MTAINRLLIIVLAISIIQVMPFGMNVSAAEDLDWTNYTMVFYDEFNGTGLDTAKWNNFHRNSSPLGNSHIVTGDSFAYCPDNVTVPGDGYAHIKNSKEEITVNGVTVPYRTGMLQTSGKFYQIGGRFEARIKMPDTMGAIPAFWLMPNDTNDFIGLGGKSAEIDIMEHTMRMSNYVTNNVHWGGYGTSHQQWGEKKAYVTNPTDWHVYAVNWIPPDTDSGVEGRYEFYVDGVLKNTYVGTAVSYGNQMLILSMALGGWGGTIDDTALPSEMLVDWCRVYQRNEDIKVFPDNGYSVNFNNNTGWASNNGFENGQKFSGWTFNTQSGNNAIKVLDQGGGNNCLNFVTYPTTHTQWPAAQFDFIQTSKRISDIEFKTYFTSGHNIGFTVAATFNDAPNTWVDLVYISANGGKDYISIDRPTIFLSLPNDQYCKFNIMYDNNSNGAKKVMVFKDDLYLCTINPSNFPSNRNALQSIRFNMVSNAYDADFRIDDVHITESNNYIHSSFKDENGVQLKNITSGYITANINVINTSLTAAMPLSVIAATYKDNELTKISIITDVIPKGSKKALASPISIDGTESLLKIMIWNSMMLGTPYMESYILEKK